MDNLFFNRNENLLWISTLLLTLLGIVVDLSYLNILLYWIVIILAVGNAKRVYSTNENIFITFLRRSFYIWPLVLPILIKWEFSFTNLSLIWTLIGIFIGFIFIIPKISVWRIVLSNDFLLLSIKSKNTTYYYMGIYTLVGGAISEELFFRYFLLSNYSSLLILVINVGLSSFLFMLLHYGTKWADSFDTYDLVIQLLFGLASSILLIFSESIIPSIVAHLTYNSPHVIQFIKIINITNKMEINDK